MDADSEARAGPGGLSGCIPKAAHLLTNAIMRMLGPLWSISVTYCPAWSGGRYTAGTAELRHPFFDNSCIGFHLPLSFSLGGCSICREIASTGDR